VGCDQNVSAVVEFPETDFIIRPTLRGRNKGGDPRLNISMLVWID
jgi:hypothetical protein